MRAYATNTAGTFYGAEVSFDSNPRAMVVETQAVTALGKTSAVGNGSVVNLGVPAPTQHGLCGA